MTPLAGAAILAAGFAAGSINTIVGSGSLVTFPTLLALGYPPVLANVSNTTGLFPGSISGAVGYRRELAGQWPRVARLAAAGAVGGATGAALLLALPGSVFRGVVPALVLLACVLVAVQPWLSARVLSGDRARRRERWGLHLAVAVTGVYGGYFGAAQGVLLIALLGLFLDDGLQRLNGAKNVIAACVNLVAAVFFVFLTPVAWGVAGLLAVGSIAGGQVGAAVGRRLPAPALRYAIVVGGTAVAVWLLVR